MEYFVYQIQENKRATDVIAIRQSWGLEEKIYKAIGNAIILPMMDHIFLMPLHTKGTFIPQMPAIVMDGVYYGFNESCNKCVNRTRKVTMGGCEPCVFAPIGKRREFDYKSLEKLLRKEAAGYIDILSQMEKKSIYEIYHLYHFKNFFSEELPLRLDEFLSFIRQFNVETLFSNEQEIFFEEEGITYQAHIHSEFINEKIYKRAENEIRTIFEETKDKIKVLTKKKEFLQRILKNNK